MKSEEELLGTAKNYGWKWISQCRKLSEPFIEKYKDKVDWKGISYSQILSESFIEKFQDKVDWHWISAQEELSESFIEKFQDRVEWQCISCNQKLSEEFVLDNFSKIYLAELKRNKYFDFNNIKNKELKLLLDLRGEA